MGNETLSRPGCIFKEKSRGDKAVQLSEDVEVVHDVENVSTITPSSIVAMTKCGNIDISEAQSSFDEHELSISEPPRGCAGVSCGGSTSMPSGALSSHHSKEVITKASGNYCSF